MASRYARANLHSEDIAGRFQAGALSPVDAPDTGENRGGTAQSKPLRAFDRTLLLVEIAGALVISWLVLQYVYTVYFDTAPRRVTPQRSMGQATQALSGVSGGLVAVTPSPTKVAQAVPFTGDASQAEAWSGADGVQASKSSIMFTPTPNVDPALLLPVRLRIPAMFLDSAVHEVKINMGQWEVSPLDIGHHEGTANPSEVGNVVLAGHRDINSALFRELDRLEPGDEVYVSDSLHEYRYVVKESFIVAPNHVEVMDPTDDSRVTLITCTPPGLATQRLVVTATRE